MECNSLFQVDAGICRVATTLESEEKETIMSKRLTLKRLLALSVCSVALTTPAHSADKVHRLKLAETWPSNFPIFGDATKNMAKLAEEMSNGRLKITIDRRTSINPRLESSIW